MECKYGTSVCEGKGSLGRKSLAWGLHPVNPQGAEKASFTPHRCVCDSSGKGCCPNLGEEASPRWLGKGQWGAGW